MIHYLEKVKRKSLSGKKKLEIFKSHNGVCHICGGKIGATRTESWEVEHIIPLWQGGEDEEQNMAPAHTVCHKPKSNKEATERAKSNRIHAKHFGYKAKKSRPIPGSKASGLRKRMDGTVERRT